MPGAVTGKGSRHLGGTGQGGCWTAFKAQDGPTTNIYPSQNVNSAEILINFFSNNF